MKVSVITEVDRSQQVQQEQLVKKDAVCICVFWLKATLNFEWLFGQFLLADWELEITFIAEQVEK